MSASKDAARRGTPSAACYLTINGAVEKVLIRGDRRVRVGLAGPGKAFGYESLIDDRPSPVTVITRERTLLLVLPRDPFKQLFGRDDTIARVFLDVILRDLVATLRLTLRPHARLAASVSTMFFGRDGSVGQQLGGNARPRRSAADHRPATEPPLKRRIGWLNACGKLPSCSPNESNGAQLAGDGDAVSEHLALVREAGCPRAARPPAGAAIAMIARSRPGSGRLVHPSLDTTNADWDT